MTAFINTQGETLDTLGLLTAALNNSETVNVTNEHGQAWVLNFPREENARFPGGIYVHNLPARNLDQLVSYVDGDTHDQSKVDWFDGNNFVGMLP